MAAFPNDTPFIQIPASRVPYSRVAKFGWLGSLTSETTVCVARSTAKVKTFADLLKTPLLPEAAASNNTETLPVVLNSVLAPNSRSSQVMPLARQRPLPSSDEVDGLCTSYNTIATRNPDWFAQGKVNILVQSALRKNSKIPDVPLDLDLTKTPEDKAVLELNNARLELGCPFVTTPNLPPDRLQALRNAFDETLKDPDFVNELTREKLDLEPVSGPAAQAILNASQPRRKRSSIV